MSITNTSSGTNVNEIAAGIYRISTPVPPGQMPGGFTFNQILVADEATLLFHTGLRGKFQFVREAVAHELGDAARLARSRSRTSRRAEDLEAALALVRPSGKRP